LACTANGLDKHTTPGRHRFGVVAKEVNDGVLPLASGAKVLVTGPSSANPAILTAALNTRGLATEGYSTNSSPTTSQINTATWPSTASAPSP